VVGSVTDSVDTGTDVAGILVAGSAMTGAGVAEGVGDAQAESIAAIKIIQQKSVRFIVNPLARLLRIAG